MACLLSLISCTTVKQGAFLYPSYDEGDSKVLRRDCCGGAGPEEVLVLNAPNKVKYIVLMRPSENKINGNIGVFIPVNVKVEFSSDMVNFIALERDELRFQLKNAKETDLTILNPKCLNVMARGLKPDRTKNSLLHEFTGKGEKGTFVWAELTFPWMPSGKFRILIPEIIVEGQHFKPGPVDLMLREPDAYIYPLNC